jgi:integrase
MVDLQLMEDSAKNHRAKIRRFLEWLGDRSLAQSTLREYLSLFNEKSQCTYANQLKSLKVFCRDFLEKPELVASFKFPSIPFKPKKIPSREELVRFYNSLETLKDKALFLVYATSGLRRKEVL